MSDFTFVTKQLAIANGGAARDGCLLYEFRVRLVVNMAKRRASSIDLEEYAQRAIQYHHLPMSEYEADDAQGRQLVRERLHACHVLLAGLLPTFKAGKQTALVHCEMGVSRSAAAVMYHLMHTRQQPFAQVLEDVTRLRPCVWPYYFVYRRVLGELSPGEPPRRP